MVPAGKWAIVAACLGSGMLPGTSSAQGQSPPSGRWEASVSIGGTAASRSDRGSGADVPRAGTFTTITNRQSYLVPSWYFGDGTNLLGAVNTALLVDPGMTGIGTMLTAPFVESTHGATFGGRLTRTLNPRWSVDLSVDYSTVGVEMRASARQVLEGSRAAFPEAWQAFFRGAAVTESAVTSSLAVVEGDASQVVTAGAFTFNLRTSGRHVPFLVFGVGMLTRIGELPSARLEGDYEFAIGGVSRIRESDRVLVEATVPRHRIAGFGGAGFKYWVTPRWGLRTDLRIVVTQNAFRTEVTGSPSRTTAPGEGVSAATTTVPAIQFSNIAAAGAPPSSLSGSLSAFTTYRGVEQLAQVSVTAGIMWRF